MKLTGLHLLLTYRCTYECDHCFVWGSPNQTGTMTLGQIREILLQGADHGTVEWIYFEGGEPLLLYPVLLKGIDLAREHGFQVGIVSNAFWATGVEDAVAWLEPLAGKVDDLSISKDSLHGNDDAADIAREAAELLGIPMGTISVVDPATAAWSGSGRIPHGSASVRFRGRAARNLAEHAPHSPARHFTECPYENLVDPGRVHVDPFGNLHICQGIVFGNLFETGLNELCAGYDPQRHPVVGPLIEGGPAELARRNGVSLSEEYADACHLCYETRCLLKDRYPRELAPDQMYGVTSSPSSPAGGTP